VKGGGMTGEPELYPNQSGEWVTYLQQLMKYHGWWAGAENGEFDDELTHAVRTMQTQHQVTADGVVRASTWALLTQEASQPAAAGSSQAQPSGGAGGVDAGTGGHGGAPGGGAAADGQHGLHGTGAQSTEYPASFQAGGLPAFRYTLPSVPLAEASFDTGQALVHLQLSFTGGVSVTFPHAAQGVSTSVNDQTWRVAATQSLGGITEGIQIQGIGSDRLSFSTTFGNAFEQTEVRYTPPNTLSFLGRCTIAFHAQTDVGYATVQGSPGFQLDVTVTPHPEPVGEPVGEPVEVTDEHSWLSRYGPALVAVGVTALVVVVAIAAAPETGGGSLLAIPEAEAMGAAAAGAF
jgi:peptidoglycan hydrolase-like protein with peptidoglycan-binding domain